MTNKCCLNCMYLCLIDEKGKAQTWPEPLRYHGLEEMQKEANCYHKQWQAYPVDNERGVDPIEVHCGELDYSDIVDLNFEKLPLDNYSCHLFLPFDETKTTLLDRIWQEHQQQQRDARDNLRFWTMAGIGGVTALAVIASAFFHWLEWGLANDPGQISQRGVSARPPAELHRSSALVTEAHHALGKYDGMLEAVLNPNVLLSPLMDREAEQSSRIEGTQATLREVLEFEAGDDSAPRSASPIYGKS